MGNRDRLFYGSCFALITTALSFSIRAGILAQLGEGLKFDAGQLGWINTVWFLGFPVSLLFGGLLYNRMGAKRIMQVALFSHGVGIIMTVVTGSYFEGSTAFIGLLTSTLLIGLGNGCTEAACNPMIADSYEGVEMSKKMNRFHMWFPGGIVIGAFASKFMTDAGISWQTQIWLIMIPTVIYAILFWGQEFPKPRAEAASFVDNLMAMLSPLFFFMVICMTLTAVSEFGPNQWVTLILSLSGAHPITILALVFGGMTIARYFGGVIVGKIDQTGVLLGGAVLTTVGLYLLRTAAGDMTNMSTVNDSMAYIGTVVYVLGIAYFWPNMIGFVADYIPRSGAIGMSIIGGAGMVSTSIWGPVFLFPNVNIREVLLKLMYFPGSLIVLFGILFIWTRKIRAARLAGFDTSSELPRFSLRTLMIFMALAGSGYALYAGWQSHRPDAWYGIFRLPAFYPTVLCTLGLIWSIWRDRRMAGPQQAETT